MGYEKFLVFTMYRGCRKSKNGGPTLALEDRCAS